MTLSPVEESGDCIAKKKAKNFKREETIIWEELKKSCLGCWSGTIALFDFDSNSNQLKSRKTSPERLNFRLQVKLLDKDNGNWTVYNTREQGDVISVPVGRVSNENGRTNDIGFDERIIARCTKQGYIFEIGFWSDGFRKTAIVTLGPLDGGISSSASVTGGGIQKRLQKMPALFSSQRSFTHTLTKVSFVHQKFLGKQPKNFAGGDATVIDDGNFDVMPAEGKRFLIGDDSSHSLSKMVSVDLNTYQRTTKTKSSFDSHSLESIRRKILDPIKDASSSTSDPKKNGRFAQIAPNGIYISSPKKISRQSEEESFIFANQKLNGIIQVVEYIYDTKLAQPKSVNAYTFKPKKKLA